MILPFTLSFLVPCPEYSVFYFSYGSPGNPTRLKAPTRVSQSVAQSFRHSHSFGTTEAEKGQIRDSLVGHARPLQGKRFRAWIFQATMAETEIHFWNCILAENGSEFGSGGRHPYLPILRPPSKENSTEQV